ncbi:hypothetical protein AYK25_02530 [Thermoplasmatales archaeon SM1-50]|nr:MAG: hypothetical protein AYK25_02530 [Thermoplasmatales archaeon SM1-50]
MISKKEKEEIIDDLQNEQSKDKESDSDLVLEKEMKIEMKKDGTNYRTEIVPRDHVVLKLDSYLSEAGLNMGKSDYCYVKIVGNHLEIGRAKIVLEE